MPPPGPLFVAEYRRSADAVWQASRVRIWRALDEVPGDLGPTVVTVGNFDGVHRGHQHVVTEARRATTRLGAAETVVVTFEPHPMAVLRPEHAPLTLTTVPERLALLGELGVGAALVLPFDRSVAAWSPQEFVDRVLVRALRAAAVVVGANFRFGHRAAGDVGFLREAGGVAGFEVEGLALDGGPQVWSSTYVRTCLAAGDVEGAAEALGRPYAVLGAVARGEQRGQGLGYPTANVPVAATRASVADGVYAGWLRRTGTSERHPAAISVGTNPTFEGERTRAVEAYVLDRDDLDLYGTEVEIGFLHRLRGMRRFDSVEDLRAAMADDVRRTRELLGA